MQVNQIISILFYRKRKKKTIQGLIPIYCRVTIDGLSQEISTGIKLIDEDWDDKSKKVLPSDKMHKLHNKKIAQLFTDLQRHFDLVIAKNGTATPALVFESFRSPIKGTQVRLEQLENEKLSIDLDDLVKRFIAYTRKVEAIEKLVYRQMSRINQLETEKRLLEKELSDLIKRARIIFDNKSWNKTFVLAFDEYVLNFLELVMSGNRSPNTLKKKWGTKKRFQELLATRYKKEDIPLAELEYNFILEFVKKEKLIYKSGDNTIWKYAQIVKEVMDRSVCNNWIRTNPFSIYRCSYTEPQDKLWPTMEQVILLRNFDFGEESKELSDIRDVFIYQCFAGPSYAELYALKPQHLHTGIDGKTWVSQKRKKSSSKESLPLLPICLEIIERFKSHPRCIRSGKSLPVPTDQYYNRALKEIGKRTKISCLNNSHQARYFFANEVAYANTIDLKMIGKLMGQRNANSIHTYIKPTERMISESMQKIQVKLYSVQGLSALNHECIPDQAKVISLTKR